MDVRRLHHAGVGVVRTKNASLICLKNIGLYAIAGLAYYVIGYNLMYVDVGGWIGSISFLYGPSADEVALVAGDESARAAVIGNNYAVMSDWFFQMVFVATAASIVSGALAERVRLWSFFVFTLVLTAFIYPVVGAWTWAAAGWTRSASRTSPDRPSCTAREDGRRSPARSSSDRAEASSGPTGPPS